MYRIMYIKVSFQECKITNWSACKKSVTLLPHAIKACVLYCTLFWSNLISNHKTLVNQHNFFKHEQDVATQLCKILSSLLIKHSKELDSRALIQMFPEETGYICRRELHFVPVTTGTTLVVIVNSLFRCLEKNSI